MDGFVEKWCSDKDEKDSFKKDLNQMIQELSGIGKQEQMLQKIYDRLDELEIKKTTSTKKSSLGNFASPAAKKLAETNNLNPEDLEGSGAGGKITVKDIRVHLPDNKKTKKTVKKQEKHPCSGVKKNGDPCGRNGNNYIEDLNQWFCHSHKGEINSQEKVTEEVVSDIESIGDGDIPYESDVENFSEDDE